MQSIEETEENKQAISQSKRTPKSKQLPKK